MRRVFIGILLLSTSCSGIVPLKEDPAESDIEVAFSQNSGVRETEGIAGLYFPWPGLKLSRPYQQLSVNLIFEDGSEHPGLRSQFLNPVTHQFEKIEWSSDDPRIAVVSPRGFVRTFRSGSTVVRARLGDLQASIALTVEEPDKKLAELEELSPLEQGVQPPPGEEGPPDDDTGSAPDPESVESEPAPSGTETPEPEAALPEESESTCDPLPASADPYVDRVVRYRVGSDGGYHEDLLPEIVLGPPRALESAPENGSFDVFSLGREGWIILEFTDYIACNGPGPDFIVFENPFQVGDNPEWTFREPAVVAVSENGIAFTEFPCSRSRGYEGCAGLHAVLANPDLFPDIDPTDPLEAGGDAFDLADVGIERARFVLIRDRNGNNGAGGTTGFDLDAIAVVNGKEN